VTDIVIGNGSDLEMGILMGKARPAGRTRTVYIRCGVAIGKATVNIIMLLFIIQVNLCDLQTSQL
jgi:hypothetical protein